MAITQGRLMMLSTKMIFLLRSLLLIFLYTFLWNFAGLFEIGNLVSAFYPAAGVIVFFVYRFGPIYILPSAIAVMVGASFVDPFWQWGAIQISMAIRQLFFYSILGLVLKKTSKFSLPLNRLSSVTILIGSLSVTSFLSALTATFLISTFVGIDTDQELNIIMSFWIGDLGGILLFLAALSLFLDFYFKNYDYNDVFQKGLVYPILLLVIISSATTLLFVATGLTTELGNFGYLILLPVAWASSFYGIRFALFSAICVNTTAIWHYIYLGLSNYPAIELQTLFSVNLVMAMLLGASLEERKTALFDATHDSLTQMLNRKAFFQESTALLERCKRQKRNMAVLMIDIDHFKVVNDNWGHEAGDQVLMQVAECCRQICRSTDIQGRLGGEEFALILDDAGPNQAIAVAERLRLSISSILVPKTDTNITTSIGISHLLTIDDTLNQLLKQADLALYTAKRTGRNKCQSASTLNTEDASLNLKAT
ncbi:hypothetical protein DN062_08220 [Nitrincola tibetensis]|uniref:diguanylate cyclase n=1 Tax=Nitrincola tibetensis TaxID=2219697 RepID=A0A364NMF2_9GAMM|nr:diguanylate cyclase [Nitrincola tibetensis]RAU18214.1 hypothetical protein DN062_08220 [Nitrincola tibetensis]